MHQCFSLLIIELFVIFLGLGKLQGNALAIGRYTTATFSVALDTDKSDKPVFVSTSSCRFAFRNA